MLKKRQIATLALKQENMKNKYNKSELFKEMFPLIKNKDVLDVGCVEHTVEALKINPFWVHNFLKDNSNVLGIDILADDVKMLVANGYNMKVANAETFKLKKKFDVIFAGELIEHLSNPGLFLQQSKKHLRENGILIITTPNTFYTPRLLECIRKIDDNPIVNAEHTNWFSPSTLKTLFRREGFDIISIKGFDAASLKRPLKAKVKYSFNKIFNKNIKGSLLVIAKVKQ